jgi:hypothetical protein
MRGVLLITLAVALGRLANAETALDAIAKLPKDAASQVARIEGRDGAPEPGRWYILTYDGTAENGLREYVVSKGKVVAARTVSQFAETLKSDDVIGAEAVKFDSDKAGKTLRAYAEANGLSVATMNYELKRRSATGTPVWAVSGFDKEGQRLGYVVLTADKGMVAIYDGFKIEPKTTGVAASKPTPAPDAAETPIPPAAAADASATPAAVAADATPIPVETPAAPADETPAQRRIHRAAAAASATASPKKNAIGRTMDSLHKILPF